MGFSKPVVVIDNGSFNIKSGFACDNHPVSIFRNTVGRPKYLNGTYGKTPYEVYIGDAAVERSDELDLNYPVYRGKIIHWDNMERVWHHVFYRELKAAPEDRAVLLSCAPTTTMKDKVKCCEIFFESLNTMSMCMRPQSLLALFGSGVTTGLSVDLGEDCTEIHPIYEGGSLTYANMVTNIAGTEIKNMMLENICKRGFRAANITEELLAKIWKQAYVTMDSSVPNCKKSYRKKLFIPGYSTTINVGDEAFWAGEIYFQPELVLGDKAKDCLSIQQAIVTSIAKCDKELQPEFYESIVVHGGMLIPGFVKRLCQEIESISGKPITIDEPTEAHSLGWLGGSVFAGMNEAPTLFISKESFEEQGERIVRRKFIS